MGEGALIFESTEVKTIAGMAIPRVVEDAMRALMTHVVSLRDARSMDTSH